MSLTPASCKRRLTAGEATRPVPRGAGMSYLLSVVASLHVESWAYTYTNGDGTTLSALLRWDGVRLTEVGTPVTTTDWHDRELGDDDSRTDSSSDFLRRLDAEPNVTLAVSDDNDSLEPRTLTSTCLLLHWFDLFISSASNTTQSYLHWQIYYCCIPS